MPRHVDEKPRETSEQRQRRLAYEKRKYYDNKYKWEKFRDKYVVRLCRNKIRERDAVCARQCCSDGTLRGCLPRTHPMIEAVLKFEQPCREAVRVWGPDVRRVYEETRPRLMPREREPK